MILKMGGSGWANRWGMHIRMRHAESLTNSQINEFLKASAGIEFSGQNRKEVYAWVEKMLVEQEYQQHSGVRSQGETDFTARDLRGLRPGEILALRWKTLENDAIRVEERIYKRALHTTRNGKTREGAISDGTLALIKE